MHNASFGGSPQDREDHLCPGVSRRGFTERTNFPPPPSFYLVSLSRTPSCVEPSLRKASRLCAGYRGTITGRIHRHIMPTLRNHRVTEPSRCFIHARPTPSVSSGPLPPTPSAILDTKLPRQLAFLMCYL